MPSESAGILLYRTRGAALEVLIAHPGGPYWRGKDQGAWSIPKGELSDGEEPVDAAIRELGEETGARITGDVHPLGSIRLRSGKVVHAWAARGDIDPDSLVSNTFEIEWPPRSGRFAEFPEVDVVRWVDPDEARRRLNPAQAELVGRLEALLASQNSV